MEKFHINNAKSDARCDFIMGRSCSLDWEKGKHFNKIYEVAYWKEMDSLMCGKILL